MTTGGQRFLKVILFIFNTIFAIGGLVSLICGGVALGALNSGAGLITVPAGDHSLTGAAGLLIAIGVFVFVTAILGCIAAVREHRGALIAYAVILLFILILQFAAAITAFVLKDKVKGFISKQLSTMETNIKNDTKTELDPVGKAFYLFQKDWKCCGIDGPEDWMKLGWFNTKYSVFAKSSNQNVTFPGCCFGPTCQNCSTNNAAVTVDCVTSKDKTAFYTEGCTEGLADYMKRNVGIVAGVALTFGLIQILGIILACCLARSLHQSGHERIG